MYWSDGKYHLWVRCTMIVQVEAVLSLPLHALPPPSQLAPTLVSSFSCYIHFTCTRPYYLIYCILRFCYQPVPRRYELVSSACLVKEWKVASEPRALGPTQLSLLKMRNTFRDLKQPSRILYNYRLFTIFYHFQKKYDSYNSQSRMLPLATGYGRRQ